MAPIFDQDSLESTAERGDRFETVAYPGDPPQTAPDSGDRSETVANPTNRPETSADSGEGAETGANTVERPETVADPVVGPEIVADSVDGPETVMDPGGRPDTIAHPGGWRDARPGPDGWHESTLPAWIVPAAPSSAGPAPSQRQGLPRTAVGDAGGFTNFIKQLTRWPSPIGAHPGHRLYSLVMLFVLAVTVGLLAAGTLIAVVFVIVGALGHGSG